MTRRTFQKQAALFVLGCALQVCVVLPKIKLPEVVGKYAILNPAWETARYRIAFIMNPAAQKKIMEGVWQQLDGIRTNNPNFISEGMPARDRLPQYVIMEDA